MNAGDDTPTDGIEPDEFVKHVREVVTKTRAKVRRLERIAAQGELLEVSLHGWKAEHTTARDRGRDMDDVFKLREAARLEGVIE